MAYELLNAEYEIYGDQLEDCEVKHTKASDMWAFGMVIYVRSL